MFNKARSALNTERAGNKWNHGERHQNRSTTLYVPLPVCFGGMVFAAAFQPEKDW
jgi:predicted transporter